MFPWVCGKHGITVADAVLLNSLEVEAMLFMPPWMIDVLAVGQGASLVTSYPGGIIPFTESALRSERTLATEFLFAQRPSIWSRFVKGSRGRRVLFRKDLYHYVLNLKTVSSDEKSILAERAEELAHGEWFLVSNGECPDEPLFRFGEFVDQFAGTPERSGPIDVVAELYRSEESLQARNSKLAEVWTSVIGGAAIPFRGPQRDTLRERLHRRGGRSRIEQVRSA